MEIIKKDTNTEFDVIYSDGERLHVTEGVLWSVENNMITFHNGTSRLNVLFAAIEDAIGVVDHIGFIEPLADYLFSPPDSVGCKKLLAAITCDKAAVFRLGQMDMQQSIADMLTNLADGTQGVVCSTLIDAAERVRKLSLCEKVEDAQNVQDT